MASALKEKLKPENARPESDRQSSSHHGRGGAGNIKTGPNAAVQASDLTTPTIKSDTYTTGRGGQGKLTTPLPSMTLRASFC
jgi:hypothetical protein